MRVLLPGSCPSLPCSPGRLVTLQLLQLLQLLQFLQLLRRCALAPASPASQSRRRVWGTTSHALDPPETEINLSSHFLRLTLCALFLPPASFPPAGFFVYESVSYKLLFFFASPLQEVRSILESSHLHP